MGYFRYLVYGSAILYIVFKLLRKFYFSGGKCPKEYILPLKKKTILITGGSTGIGFGLAKEYVKLNAKKVIICSRNVTRGKEALKVLRNIDLKTRSKTEIEFIQLDLGSLSSIESVAKRVEDENIDFLVLNAACFTPGGRKVSTSTGTELMYQVGFLGHFHLVNCLFENMVTRDVRVIATTGGQNMMPLKFPEIDQVFTKMEDVGMMEVFGLAKTSMMLFMKHLDRKFSSEDSMSSAYYLHPGMTAAGMGIGDNEVPFIFKILRTFVMSPLMKIVGKSETEIIQTHLYLTFAPRNILRGGGYFVDCQYTKELDFFNDKENIKKVWELGSEIIKKIKDENVEEEEEEDV